MTQPEAATCFVISPIGPEGSEVRKQADQVLKHIIKKALSEKYKIERADDISKPGLITLQVIENLMKAPMVVADLTNANANVYYELAIRHFVKKPVVHLITEGQDPLFDVAQMRYIRYDLTNPDSVEEARKQVHDHAAACEKGEVVYTPIQFVEALDTARNKGENQFVDLALGIQSALSNLQSEVRLLRNQLPDQNASITELALAGYPPEYLNARANLHRAATINALAATVQNPLSDRNYSELANALATPVPRPFANLGTRPGVPEDTTVRRHQPSSKAKKPSD